MKEKITLNERKSRIALILVLTILMQIFMPIFTGTSKVFAETTWNGEGTESDPYLISNIDDLKALANSVNNGEKYEGKFFKLTADIDSGNENWVPIGNKVFDMETGNDVLNCFGGTFDGNRKKITYHISGATSDYMGLFNQTIGSTVIKNLEVSGSIEGTSSYYGGITGKNDRGTITNCVSSVSITGTRSFYGGIVGHNNYGTIKYCISSGTLTKNGSGYAYIAGITGSTYEGTITNCTSLSDISASNANQYSYASRVIGRVTGAPSNTVINNCYYLSTVTTTGEVNADNATGKTIDELKGIGKEAYNNGYTLYAASLGYTAVYTVTFNTNGGAVNSGNITTYEEGTGATLPTDVTRNGYTFAGWYDNKDLTGSPVTKIEEDETGNIEYWAKWEINKYSVIFKDYDGTILKTQENVEYNTSATAPSNPTREGFIFTGWNKSFDKVTEDLVVTAQYEVKPGEVEVKEVESNVGSATVSLNNQNVEDLIELSTDEQNAISAGKDVYVFVEVGDISDSVSDEDKELVKTKLEDGSTVGMYLDINLFKQIEGENKVKVEETNGKVKVSFELPESLRASNRNFYIIRVHGTEVTKITPTVNGNTLTFETDRFSTYALAYTDTDEETTTAEDTTPTPTTTTETETTKSSNPKTGDNIITIFSIFAIATLGTFTTLKLNRNRKTRKH